MFLYRVKQPLTPRGKPAYFLGGYFTLFTFRNPVQGSLLRVCQVSTRHFDLTLDHGSLLILSIIPQSLA
jgi:hypothetical protein